MWRWSALALIAFVFTAATCMANEAQVWFGLPQPRPDVAARLRANPGDQADFLARLDNQAADWDQFFKPGTFDSLVPLFQVYMISTGSFLGMPDAELVRAIAMLSARGRKLAFVAQPVVIDSPTCGHSEGYEDQRILNAAVEKLKRLNIPVAYLALDGGLWYGHYAVGGQSCGLTLDETIRQTAITVHAFSAAFPDIVVGDIEPTVPLTQHADWQDSFRDYKRGLESLTGKAVDFLELDIAWDNPEWKSAVRAETDLAHRLGMHIAYIYDGDGEDRGDAAWLSHARRNIAEMEGGLGLVPDHASIVSWNPHPTHLVGASLDGTLASLLPYYAQPRTQIALSDGRNAVGGEVKDGSVKPLAGYSVTVSANTIPKQGDALEEQAITGTVPARARSAIIGLRINSECLCTGRDELLIGPMRYEETAGGNRSETVDFGPEFRRLGAEAKPGVATVRLETDGSETVAHVQATADQSLLLNSAVLAVTPNAGYKFTASLRDLLGTDMFGEATIIWVDGRGQGLGRANMVVRPHFVTTATVKTDAAGRFSAPWPRGPQGHPAPLRIVVPDQDGRRGAILDVP